MTEQLIKLICDADIATFSLVSQCLRNNISIEIMELLGEGYGD
jgi:hypothetical protein